MSAAVIEPGQLARLSDELESLLRAGSPLGPGLRNASLRWRGSLRPAAERLAHRLDSGVPVDEALRTSPELPPMFRSLAAAGLATHRGADVLAAYSDSTRQLLSLRERLLRGLMYPAIVVVLAYVLFIALINTLLPQMVALVTDFAGAPPWWAAPVERLRASVHIWSWAIPAILIAVWMVVHLVFRASLSTVGWWGLIPIVRGTLTDIHTASASHLLAALLECDVPLPLALELASESLDSERTRQSLRDTAEDIRLGVPAGRSFRERAGAPPLWRALFAREAEPLQVKAGLLQVADVLSQRARSRTDVIGRILPVALVIVIGGAAVTGYAAAVFGPLIELWRRMGAAP